MIYFLVTAANRNALDAYFDTFGKPVSGSVEVIPYEEAFKQGTWFPGTYVFSDIELIDDETRGKAVQLWDALSGTGETRLLNHPTRSMRSYELLSSLYESGKNSFNIYHLPEIDTAPGSTLPFRFPVFLQKDSSRLGKNTPIIYGHRQFIEVIKEMESRNLKMDQYDVVEYCDASDNKGIYRKYACFILGDVLMPKFLYSSREWPAHVSNALNDKESTEAELSYLEDTTHFKELKEIFRHARIEYGRIDYTLLDGKIQTFGIYTNPVILGEGKRSVTSRLEISRSFADKINDQISNLASLSGDEPIITDLELNKAV